MACWRFAPKSSLLNLVGVGKWQFCAQVSAAQWFHASVLLQPVSRLWRLLVEVSKKKNINLRSNIGWYQCSYLFLAFTATNKFTCTGTFELIYFKPCGTFLDPCCCITSWVVCYSEALQRFLDLSRANLKCKRPRSSMLGFLSFWLWKTVLSFLMKKLISSTVCFCTMS